MRTNWSSDEMMCVHTIFTPDYEIAWGYDPVCHYFVRVYDRHCEGCDLLEELDTLFDNVGINEVAEVAAAYGANKANVIATLQ